MFPYKKASQKAGSTSKTPFSNLQDVEFTNFKANPSSNNVTPLPEELLQQQYRDGKTQQEGKHWERAALPQKKKPFMENVRLETINHLAPYRLEREGKTFSLYNMYKCKCHYCQLQKEQRENVSGNSKEKDSSSWNVLVQGLNQLNLNSDTAQACCVPKDQPQK
ncbi:protein FAM156A/FAM156B-like [Erinaceus europaeus]|uniref:Protein FAM156A/FAM156B-like n=1 Tax=Erinaceus europaeus TaxID=9365 RepID=A0A1S3AQN3_ERIEU|nr:protein FAM156A/FAM156B-like [Erinaceus europaeus]